MSDGEQKQDIVDRSDGWLGRGEHVLLVVIIAVMVGLATLQLVLRMTIDFGFEWADIVVRQMVLWLGFVGGALATHKSRHIAIDAARKFLSPKRGAMLRAFTSLIAVGITFVMIRASFTFISDEIENETKVFGEFPSWPFQIIIPVAFIAIAFHFLVTTRNNVLIALGRREPAAESEEL